MAQRLRGRRAAARPPSEPIDAAALDARRRRRCAAQFDAVNGGWGGAPKFPAASTIEFLLRARRAADDALHAALDGLGRHLRPGRRRLRALQRRRDLDDPALREDALRQRAARPRLPARLAGHAATPLLRRTAEETLDWALREMRAPEGGFYSALDADSEGVEGKFYVWTLDELRDVLGARRRRRDRAGSAPRRTATSRAPNQSSRPAARARRRARAAHPRAACSRARDERVRPGLDDKRLTAWNALMIAALADAGAVLERADYLDAARDAAELRARRACATPTAGCCARSTPGEARLNAYLEDHAFLLEALLDALRGDVRAALVHRGARARRRAPRALRRPRARRLLLDRPTTTSSSSPGARTSRTRRSPRAARRAAFGLLRLAALTGEHALRAPRRWATCACCTSSRPRHPGAFGHLLQALDFHLRPVREVALVGGPRSGAPLLAVVRGRLRGARRPRRRRRADAGGVPLLEGRDARRRRRGRLRLRALRLPPAGDRRPSELRGAARVMGPSVTTTASQPLPRVGLPR